MGSPIVGRNGEGITGANTPASVFGAPIQRLQRRRVKDSAEQNAGATGGKRRLATFAQPTSSMPAVSIPWRQKFAKDLTHIIHVNRRHEIVKL